MSVSFEYRERKLKPYRCPVEKITNAYQLDEERGVVTGNVLERHRSAGAGTRRA
jgi:hypothetical protein